MSAPDGPGPWTRLRRSFRTRFLSGLLVLISGGILAPGRAQEQD